MNMLTKFLAIFSLSAVFSILASEPLAAAEVENAPVISYVSGSGPYPQGTREVEIIVSTDVDASCKASKVDSNASSNWKKYLTTSDNRTHSIRTPLANDEDTFRYIRCRSLATQVVNTISFEFPITFGESQSLTPPQNFEVDRPNATDGHFTLSWDAVSGASDYHLMEQDLSGVWQSLTLDDGELSIDLHRSEMGDFQYKVAACSDVELNNCSAFSNEIMVWVGMGEMGDAPIISYVSGSGPHPNGVDSIEMIVSTDINATCRGNHLDTGVFSDWTKHLSTSDNRLHRITVPISGAGDTEKYIRCQAMDSLETNTTSFVFPITINEASSVGMPENFVADPVSNTGNYTLSWDPVPDAVTYLLKESTDGENWTRYIVDASEEFKDYSKTVDGNYQYYLFACSDELGLDCGKCAAKLTVYVNGGSSNNVAPVITSSPLLSGAENVLYSYDVQATDANTTDVLTYSLTTSPAGMTIISDRGVISWIPESAQVGSHSITVSVADDAGLTDTQTFELVIDDINEAPTIVSAAVTQATQGASYAYPVEATDPDTGDSLTYSLTVFPTGMTIDSLTGIIDWSPTHDQVSDHDVTIVVTDTAGLTATQIFVVTVANVNDAPEFTSTPITTGQELVEYSYQLTASDKDNDSLTFDGVTLPDGMTISVDGLLLWTPSIGQEGAHDVSVSVTDPSLETTTQSFIVQVDRRANTAPVADAQSLITNEDTALSIVLIATDVDNDVLTYEVVTNPTNGALTGTAPNLTYIPNANFFGSDSFTFKANDGVEDSNVETVLLDITSNNNSPRITSLPITIATANYPYVYLLSAEDNDLEEIVFSKVNGPLELLISETTGEVTWEPTESDVGEHMVTLEVSDGRGGTDTQLYFITVTEPPNNAPVITSSPTTSAAVSEAYLYQIIAIDEDGDFLSYELLDGPLGMTVGAFSGVAHWVPTGVQVGNFPVTILVSDGKGGTTQQRFQIEVVVGDNQIPTIDSLPVKESVVGRLYSYPVIASDPDNDQLNYVLLESPGDMVINENTGLISWIPEEDTGVALDVKVRVFDSKLAFAEQSYQINVSDIANSAPKIISLPVSNAKESDIYEYQLEVNDPDVDEELAYSKLAGPDNLTIDNQLGLIRWTPDETFVSAGTEVSIERPKGLQKCRVPVAGISEKTPVLKWTFDEHISTDMLVPVVGPLVDTNNDGLTNEEDDAFIAISTNRSSGNLYVYNALTYELAWSFVEQRLNGAGLALGDVDGDGATELFALVKNDEGLKSKFKQVMAFNGDGTIKWISEVIESTSSNINIVLGLADIDGDGSAEIYGPNFVLNSDGSLRWQVSAEDTNNKAEVFAGDLDLDGFQEIAMGPNVYDHQGNLLFSFDEENNGNVILAVSNFDDDPYAEMMVHYNGRLAVAQHDGQISIESEDTITKFNNVTVADFDGDGYLDIGEGGVNEIWAYNNEAKQLWTYDKEIYDSTNFSSASSFDFDGDGSSELIVNDESNIFVMDGKGTFPLYKIGSPSVTQSEGHLVVDVDKDGHGELIAYSHGYFSIYEDVNDSWPNTRRIWNQHNYMSKMINDDGSVPRVPFTQWNSEATLKHNPSLLDTILLADIVTGVPEVEFLGQHTNIRVQVVNNGEKQSEATTARLYAGTFGQASQLIDEIQVSELLPSEQLEIEFLEVDSQMYSQELFILVDEENFLQECNEDNNVSKAAFVKVEVEDLAGEKDQQSYWVGVAGDNSAPIISSTAITQTNVNEYYEYGVIASDSDFSDRLFFSIEGAPLNFKIDSATGLISGKALQGSEGAYEVVVNVADLEGASFEQSFVIEVGESDNQYSPRFTSMPAVVGYEGVDYKSSVNAVDDDGDTVSYELLSGPEEMSLDATTGEIVWTPSEIHLNNYWELIISATDGRGSYTSVHSHINVYENTVNVAPTIFGQPKDPSVVVGESYRYTPNVSDPDGDTLTFELTKAPAGLSIVDPLKGTIDWLTSSSDIGSHELEWTITDEGSNSVTISFFLHVREDGNSNPTISLTNIPQAVAGLGWSFQTVHNDVDGDELTLALRTSPVGMSIEPNSGLVSWIANNSQVGSHQFEVTASDSRGGFAIRSFTVNAIRGDNNVPIITSSAPLFANNESEYVYQVEASDSDQDSISFDLETYPDGMSISLTGEISWQPTLENIGQHSVTLNVEDEFGGKAVQSYLLQVSSVENHIPEILSQPLTNLDGGANFNYQVIAIDSDGDSLTFELRTAPEEMEIDASGIVNWQTSNLDIGEHLVIIRATDPSGAWVEQSFTLNVNFLNQLPEIISLASTTAIIDETYQYNVIATDPDGDVLTYDLLNSPENMTIDSESGVVEWSVLDVDRGLHTVHLRVSDSRNGFRDQVFYLTADNNNPPVFSSVPSLQIGIGENYQYTAQASDTDNHPLSYTLSSAPDNMTIDMVSGLVEWNTTGNEFGVYQVSIKVEDGFGGEAFQQYNLTLAATSQNSRPEITSAPSNEASVGFEYTYQVIATDVDNDILNYLLVDSPQSMTIDQSGLISWSPEDSQQGTQSVTVQVDDGELSISQLFDITVYDEPLPLAVSVVLTPKVAEIGETVTIEVSYSGGAGNKVTAIIVEGESVSVVDDTAQFTPSSIGRYDVDVTVTDDSQSQVKNSYFTVGDDTDVEAPVVTIHSPGNHTEISNMVDIIASVNDVNLANYFVALFSANESFTLENATILGESETNVDSAVVAQFDPTMLTNGLYHIIVQAEDLNGQQSSSSVTLQVSGDLKVGNFSISLEDKSIPLAGIPIRVVRTYDSRRKSEELDFGYGWSVDYQSVTLNESSEPTRGWYQYQSDSLFNIDGSVISFPSTCTASLGEKLVTVTLPNGDVETFVARARAIAGGAVSISNPDCTLVGGRFINLTFDPKEGTDSELLSLDGQNLYLSDLDNGNLALDIIEAEAKDVKSYQLTTRAGYIYKLDQYFGIETITDPNGNTITYSDDGIVHSGGKRIDFVRDSNGRITSIIDPKGETVNYQYNASGDLTSVTDELGNETSYVYNNEHGLLDIVDPLGRTLVKNIYDNDGRLIAQEDNLGNRTDFTHDLVGRQSIVTDRLGRVTTLYYDNEGNVTSQVDALNNVTSFTYDAEGNQLSKTDALSRVTSATFNEDDDQLTQTDALGEVVSFTYNDKGQELTITDEKGQLFTNVYDAVGNLVSITDPQKNVVSNVINAQGLPTSVTDALGQVTTYTYDLDGNKLTETDPLGAVTSYTYDANNNVLTQTLSRTLADDSVVDETVTYVYDAMDRVTSTTNALGETSTVEYDVLGNQVAAIDELGRRMETDYDAFGRVIEMRNDDGTSSSKTYDNEGNLLTETDQNGNVTSFEYDKLNRLIKTTYADSSTTETEYDAVGQVTASIDALGNRTEYEYDLAGRRTTSTNALGNVHQFSYDKAGNLVSETDALLHTTSYTYDSLDRKTQTTFANTTTASTGYDALARRTSSTDQAGVVIDYAYDAAGRLISVTDIEGNVTSYTYDEAGNKLTQTDAELRTTSWTYDALGRVLTRTLPMGQVESFTYDVVGNMLSRTDFNGDLVSYDYDTNNRVTLITYESDSSTESFTYDNNGNRLTSTNSEGTWTYTYDVMNRLASETKPNGEVLEYTYDANSNKTQLKVTYVDASIRIESSTYDALNRLETVTDADGNKTTYGYDAVGNRVSVEHSNANVTSYVYDELNRLTQMQDKHADDTVFQQFDYQLHATGRREKITELSGRVSDYTYDSLYRLTDEVITDPINGNYTASYTFDKVGNRIASTINGVSTVYTYDDNDRLTQEGGETYTYDDNGNTLAKTIDADSTTYTYDARQKLIAANILESGVTKLSSYRYNVDGIRTQKVEEGVETNYLVDSNRAYAQVIAETDSANTVAVEYIFGDDLLAQVRFPSPLQGEGQGEGEISFYQYDGLGSTRALTDSTGSVSDEYFYDAFGVELGSSGSTENSYRYTGEQYDSSLDQYYLRARYMDTSVGRFTQMDEWMGKVCTPMTLNKYAYADDDPANGTDPSGYFTLGSQSAANSIQGILTTTARVTVRVYSGKNKGKIVKLSKQVGCLIGKHYVSRKRDRVEGHHPLQQSLGGASEQNLLFTARRTHQMLHTIQNMLIREKGLPPLNKGKSYFELFFSKNPGTRRIAFETAVTAARKVDKFCGYKGRKTFERYTRREIKRWLKTKGNSL